MWFAYIFYLFFCNALGQQMYESRHSTHADGNEILGILGSTVFLFVFPLIVGINTIHLPIMLTLGFVTVAVWTIIALIKKEKDEKEWRDIRRDINRTKDDEKHY